MVVAWVGTLVPQAPTSFFYSPTFQESVEMCLIFIDVAAPYRAPSDPAPVTVTFHQPLEKIHKLQPKKVPKVYTWPPTPPGDHNPLPRKVIEAKDRTKVTTFLSRKTNVRSNSHSR